MEEALLQDTSTKLCQDCKQIKEKKDFPSHGKYLRSYCRVCTGIKSRTQSLLRNYKTTQKEYDTLFIKQEGCCFICKRHQLEFKKRLAVDHCHSTGMIRGLLCDSCNRGIGLLKDNVTLLKSAIIYLEKSDEI